jgi:GNAT superfamily N-acetyltransferase
VDEPLRNHGYGERLLKAALQYATDANCNRIRLSLGKKQPAASQLLRRYRFHEIKRFNDDPKSERFLEHRIQQRSTATD